MNKKYYKELRQNEDFWNVPALYYRQNQTLGAINGTGPQEVFTFVTSATTP